MPLITRFAPSPTGYLHLGHGYSALLAYETARAEEGRFLLRIEDIDPLRCKPEFAQAVLEDLRWLGLAWEEPVRRQWEHLEDYAAALAKLRKMGLVYPCFCTRREIENEVMASAAAPHLALQGPDGPVYPATCRHVRRRGLIMLALSRARRRRPMRWKTTNILTYRDFTKRTQTIF